jgi:hypothetical protein
VIRWGWAPRAFLEGNLVPKRVCPPKKIEGKSQAPMAHACNPSYSGGRDQEDGGSKPAQANSSPDPILKRPSQKRTSGMAQDVDPEFKSQYCKKKKKTNKGMDKR